MCGRFVQFSLFPVLKVQFGLKGDEIPLTPSWNVAPTRTVPVVLEESGRRLVPCRWGLIPHWSGDPAVGGRMINARAETLAEKPSFKGPFARRRCLVPADGFYEWKKTGTGKTPFFIRIRGGRPFGMAGLYEDWRSPEDSTIRTFTIITTAPNDLVAAIHDRMPVIVHPDHYERWLDPDVRDPRELEDVLSPYPAGEMESWQVSRRVNAPSNDGPENIRPVGKQPG